MAECRNRVIRVATDVQAQPLFGSYRLEADDSPSPGCGRCKLVSPSNRETEDQVIASHLHSALHYPFGAAGLFGIMAVLGPRDAVLWVDISQNRPQDRDVQPANAKLEQPIQNTLFVSRRDRHAGSRGLLSSTRRKSSARIALCRSRNTRPIAASSIPFRRIESPWIASCETQVCVALLGRHLGHGLRLLLDEGAPPVAGKRNEMGRRLSP